MVTRPEKLHYSRHLPPDPPRMKGSLRLGAASLYCGAPSRERPGSRNFTDVPAQVSCVRCQKALEAEARARDLLSPGGP